MDVGTRNTLIAIPLILGAAYGGLKLYLHHRYSTALDAAIQEASPFVGIRYQGLSTTLGGEVSVEGITITPHAEFTDQVRIEAVRVVTSGLQDLMNIEESVERGEIPQKLRLVVEGLEVPMDGFTMSHLDGSTDAVNSRIAEHVSPGCGDIQHIGPRYYPELGYQRVISDFSLGYEFDESRGAMDIDLHGAMRGMAAVSVHTVVTGFASPSVQAALMSEPPSPSLMEITYRDESFTDRVTKFCAARSGQTVEAYIDRETRRDADYYALTWGIIPSPGLLDAYRKFLESPGEIRMVMDPGSAIDARSLGAYRPEDLPALLGLVVYVNDEFVEDLGFRSAPTPMVELRKALRRPRPTKAEVNTEPRIVPRYHKVRVRELPEHVGRRVRVHTTEGVVREGKLSGVKDGRIVAKTSTHGGSMEYIVPFSRVRRVEVYYAQPEKTG